MSADIAHELHRTEERERAGTRTTRARLVLGMGPATALAGVAWALVQPWRLTLLHPYGQGFWWLVTEPPLLVMAAGVFFALVVARPLLADLAEMER